MNLKIKTEITDKTLYVHQVKSAGTGYFPQHSDVRSMVANCSLKNQWAAHVDPTLVIAGRL